MMANETDVQRSMATIRNIEGFPLFVHVTRLLALGQPVPVARLAQTAGWTVEGVEAALARHPAVERDEEGRLVGLGATLRPTAHRFTFSGGTLYGWCVSDALMFPVLLGQGGTVTSSCPVTETPILIEVSPDGILSVDPPEAVVSRVRPEGPVDDVRTSICNLGNAFASRTAAAPWAAAYPGVEVSTVADDFEVHRQLLIELGWAQEGLRS